MKALSRLPLRHRVAALGEALLVVAPAERDEIAMMLVEIASFDPASPRRAAGSAAGPIELIARLPMRRRARAAHEALIALARGWGALSIQMKTLGVGLGRDRWLGVTRLLAQEPDPKARIAAMMIAHDTADPGLGPIVSRLLADEHQPVRKAADTALLRMTMLMLDHLPQRLLGAELARIASTRRIALPADPKVLELERCTLLGAIADAAWSFASHRCRSPLIAALLVMDRAVATPMERDISARMRRLLSERNHPSHSPLRTVLRRTPCPILRERSLRWLTIAPMSTAAIDRLSSSDSLDEHEIVLQRAHLALRPARAVRLRSVRQPTKKREGRVELAENAALPDRRVFGELSEAARAGLIRFSSLIHIDEQARRELIEPALADESAVIRLWACDAGSPMDLPDFLYDQHASIARHAAIVWSSTGLTPPRVSGAACKHRAGLAQVNQRSAHAWVRRLAREETERMTLLNPASPASRVQARRTHKLDPAGFVRSVRDALARSEQRGEALMLIRAMGLEARFEHDLISIVQNGRIDSRHRATAVMALGAIASSAAGFVVQEALHDRDDRVRSNAVESIPGGVERIIELKDDAHHRVRASAIRRVIRDADRDHAARSFSAARALLAMLDDRRPAHRLAASWAAQRTLTLGARESVGDAWRPLLKRIETLASGDEDHRVRSRSARCIERIEMDLKLRHENRPGGPAGFGAGIHEPAAILQLDPGARRAL